MVLGPCCFSYIIFFGRGVGIGVGGGYGSLGGGGYGSWEAWERVGGLKNDRKAKLQ